MKHLLHRAGRRVPAERLGTGLRLGAEEGPQVRFRDDGRRRLHQLRRRIGEQARDAVDDGIAQPRRGPVTDGGHAVLRGLDDGQPPALLARRHHVDAGAGEDQVLLLLGHLAVEDDAVGDALRLRVGQQLVGPPAGADDVEHRVGVPRVQRGDGVDGVLDLLVRHQARQRDQAGAAVDGTRVEGRGVFGADGDLRHRVDAVADDGDPIVVDAQAAQVVGAGPRHRDVAAGLLHRRRQPRLDEPAQPAHQLAGHRPLLAVAMVRQHHRRPARHDGREERDAVLRVHHDVGAAAQRAGDRPQPQAGGEHRAPSAHVDRVVAAAAGVPHAGALRFLRRAGVRGGAEDDAMPLPREVFGDPLEIALAAAALGVAGVAPAQQENLHGVQP